jgi:hypothetical protein
MVFQKGSHFSTANVVTEHGLDARAGRSKPDEGEILLLSALSTPISFSTQISLQWVMKDISPRVTWLSREDEHSPPNLTEVKNESVHSHFPDVFN